MHAVRRSLARRRLRGLAPLARRAGWALLLLVHLPALVGVGRSAAAGGAAEVATLLALAVTVGVFALKVLDVAILRVGARRGATCFLLAAALVHHEFAVSQAGSALLKQAPAALATGAAVEGLRRMRGFPEGLAALRRRLAATVRAALPPAKAGLLPAAAGAAPQAVAALSAAAPRAPPR